MENMFQKFKKKTLAFIILELIGAIVFTIIAVFVCRYSELLFSNYFISIIIKLFCGYEIIDIWETLLKNVVNPNGKTLKETTNDNSQTEDVNENDTTDDDIEMTPKAYDDSSETN